MGGVPCEVKLLARFAAHGARRSIDDDPFAFA
jgi:hypothetical protein